MFSTQPRARQNQSNISRIGEQQHRSADLSPEADRPERWQVGERFSRKVQAREVVLQSRVGPGVAF